eukprot:TRINITY_DN3344_c0_g1_i1.p1 TRINITY_DN3344_c0_g1~~TRINITY_DN3344_c0_g1_i1.p1  ORF type:complete len:789 (-),score=123.43 TRINITY_DN3344_c0_g1_i1:1094-3460(-)
MISRNVILIVCALAVAVSAQRGFRSACPCRDDQPFGDYTCEQQRKFGKCSEDFIVSGAYCLATCERCPIECPYEEPKLDLDCGCTNFEPISDGNYTCDEQRRFGSCSESWMIEGDYCAASCERCVCVNGKKCDNIPPPGDILCPKQAEFGKCSDEYFVSNGFCRISCGTCDEGEEILMMVPEEVDSFIPVIEALPTPMVAPKTEAIVNVVSMVPMLEQSKDVVEAGGVVAEPVLEPEEEEDSSEGEADEVLNQLVTNFNLPAGAKLEPELEPMPEPEVEMLSECNTTLLKAVQGSEDLSSLLALIRAAGLQSIFRDPTAAYTVFAPSNQAFENFFETQGVDPEALLEDPRNSELLQAILAYHVVDTAYTSAQLSQLAVVNSLLGEDFPLFVEVLRARVVIEGLASSASVVTTDIQVCNSVVHIIDEVLLAESDVADINPVNLEDLLAEQDKDDSEDVQEEECVDKTPPLEVLSEISEAQAFVTALEAVGFDDFSEEPMTILVPDEGTFSIALNVLGFDSLADAVSTDERREQLQSILLYHMIEGYFPSDVIGSEELLTTFNKEQLLIEDVNGAVRIVGVGNSAEVIAVDTSDSCNIAVHVIGDVLLPFEVDGTERKNVQVEIPQAPTGATAATETIDCQTLDEVLSSRPDLEALSETASSAGLDDVLQDPNQRITFFAPNNDAFKNMMESLGVSSATVIQNMSYLNAVLAYHALDEVYMSDDLVPGQSLPTLVKSKNSSALELTVGNSKTDLVMIGQGSTATVIEADIPACGSVIHIVDTVLLPVPPN